MEFKVGDRVRVIKQYRCTPEGCVGTVKDRVTYSYVVEFDEPCVLGIYSGDSNTKAGRIHWIPKWRLERVGTIADQKIVITHDGKTTTATLYDGKKVVKRAESKCHPDDEFDFVVGAKLAVERLSGKSKPKYFTGKVVCIKSTDDGFRQGKVYDVTDGELVGYHRWVKRCTSVKHINDVFGGVYEFIELVKD